MSSQPCKAMRRHQEEDAGGGGREEGRGRGRHLAKEEREGVVQGQEVVHGVETAEDGQVEGGSGGGSHGGQYIRIRGNEFGVTYAQITLVTNPNRFAKTPRLQYDADKTDAH